MTVAVTGTSGFVGSRLINHLIENDKSTSFSRIKFDPRLPNSFNVPYEVLQHTTTLVHCGASTPKDQREAKDWAKAASNVKSTSDLLRHNWQNLNRIIFISTLDVYSHGEEISELTKPFPATNYGLSKFMSEKLLETYCEELNIELTILRLGNLYGPGEEEYKKVIPSFIRSALQHKSIHLTTDGSELRYFLYIDEAIEMISSLVISSSNNVNLINLIGEKSISVIDIAKTIANLAPDQIKISLPDNPIAGVSHSFDVARMKSIFPKEQLPIEIGIQKEMQLFKL